MNLPITIELLEDPQRCEAAYYMEGPNPDECARSVPGSGTFLVSYDEEGDGPVAFFVCPERMGTFLAHAMRDTSKLLVLDKHGNTENVYRIASKLGYYGDLHNRIEPTGWLDAGEYLRRLLSHIQDMRSATPGARA